MFYASAAAAVAASAADVRHTLSLSIPLVSDRQDARTHSCVSKQLLDSLLLHLIHDAYLGVNLDPEMHKIAGCQRQGWTSAQSIER